jgi:hypothetical protein
LAIKYTYDKGIPKKHYIACLLIPSGLPKKGKLTSVQMIRGAYKLVGFDQIDEGTFTQKLISFSKVQQTFRGKNKRCNIKRFKFELTTRGKIKDNNWLKII